MTNKELLELSKPKPLPPQVGDIVGHWRLGDVIVESGVHYSPAVEQDLLWEMRCVLCRQYRVCRVSDLGTNDCLHATAPAKFLVRAKKMIGKTPNDHEMRQLQEWEKRHKREQLTEKDIRKIAKKHPGVFNPRMK